MLDMWSDEHIAKVKKNEMVEGRHVYIDFRVGTQG